MIYDISYKTWIDPKPLGIRFDKIDGFIRICDETWDLTLFVSEKYEAFYNRIRYLANPKCGITFIFSYYLAKIKSWFFWFFAYWKILTLLNVIIPIKSVLNKDKNHYYYKIFLEKYWYQLARK